MSQRRLRIIGPGRAGGALALAASRVGWTVREPLRRGEPLVGALDDVDLVVIATPDGAVAEVAAALPRSGEVVVAHLAGSLGLDVLASHQRIGSLHPIVSLPSPEVGADRLLDGAWFAAAGDELLRRLGEDLGGRIITVGDDQRAIHHAAACVAANHLVALMSQVERLAATIGAPVEAYLDIARGALDGVGDLGAATALTGPVSRFDTTTIRRHLDALADDEIGLYLALADEAARLSGRPTPVGGPAWR
ncbi:MAG: DUF2520 domain-containing protein [Actinomycetota bacterium]